MRRILHVLLVGVLATALPFGATLGASEVVRATPSQRGSALHFYGWSRDSRLIAYTRQRVGRTRPDQRMHRFVEGGAFAGCGKMVGGDVESYAQERGYVVVAAPARRVSETRFEFESREAAVLDMQVGRAQRWQFSVAGKVLAEHTFDRIYVDFDVALFPSPDGSQGVLVMHLDTGWEIDAAIFPVSFTGATNE